MKKKIEREFCMFDRQILLAKLTRLGTVQSVSKSGMYTEEKKIHFVSFLVNRTNIPRVDRVYYKKNKTRTTTRGLLFTVPSWIVAITRQSCSCLFQSDSKNKCKCQISLQLICCNRTRILSRTFSSPTLQWPVLALQGKVRSCTRSRVTQSWQLFLSPPSPWDKG